MKVFIKLIFTTLIFSCASKQNITSKANENTDFTIAFGSCNKQYEKNILWKEVLKNKPNVWIWGGDNIYSDTDNMEKMKNDYQTQLKQDGYKQLIKNTSILGTWDDHDYGLNDGGKEFYKKDEAQQLFLDFLNVKANDKRRNQKGVYHSKTFTTPKGSVKVIVLDTRYFRDSLTESKNKNKRYIPNNYGEGSILGTEQWQWFINELNNSKADFNVIVSSIQILSAEHGFETWGNFPHEVDKLKETIANTKAKGIFIISGDRHISEFSKTTVKNVPYPLIDFTSSGLTHSYSDFSSEPNKYRIKNVISDISFGLLLFNFTTKKVTMQMRGRNNIVLQEINQVYQ